MRLPSIENRARLQAAYRDAVAELAHADEGQDERRKRRAMERVAEAVRALRAVDACPILGWRP